MALLASRETQWPNIKKYKMRLQIVDILCKMLDEGAQIIAGHTVGFSIVLRLSQRQICVRNPAVKDTFRALNCIHYTLN